MPAAPLPLAFIPSPPEIESIPLNNACKSNAGGGGIGSPAYSPSVTDGVLHDEVDKPLSRSLDFSTVADANFALRTLRFESDGLLDAEDPDTTPSAAAAAAAAVGDVGEDDPGMPSG